MDTFKERLAFLWQNEARQAKIASDIGMTAAGFGRIWNGNGLPKAEVLKKIKELKSCSIDWLLTGQGEPFPDAAHDCGHPEEGEFVYVPRYDVQASAGHGRFVENDAPVSTVPFRRDWLEANIGDIDKLSVISVKGDSMEGVLNDGDTILVNHARNTPRDGLYVLRINDNLLVKRLQIMPGNIINVISANEAYPAFEIDLNRLTDDVAVIGRVEWFGRRL
ncbi:MAG: helix-turn-helix transcriptional regulator [Neisseria sp.]|nr:helix-turn-helix transcriptional regulator [Neisseria sp.]